VTDSVRHIDLGVVGVILMIVGAIGLIAELIVWTRRRSTVVPEQHVVDDPYGRRY